MFCGNCGKMIRDEATFCPFCGKPVKARNASARVSPPMPSTEPVDKDGIRKPVAKQSAAFTPQEKGDRANRVVAPDMDQKAPAVGGQERRPRPTRPAESAREAGRRNEQAAAAGKSGRDAARQGAAGRSKRRKTAGKREDRSFFLLSLFSKLALLLIPLAAYVPYCQIAYSAERTADMPLWKLILGGTYTMGASNPLAFTLKAHPVLIALLALPLLAVLISCFRRTRAKLPIASLMLQADGAAVLILNIRTLRTIQSAVEGLSLDTFEKQVVSMNGIIVKWVQNAIAQNKAMADTFYVTTKLGFWLLLILGGLMALLGVIGMILWIVHLLRKTEDAEADDDEAEEDDVPELAEDEL